MNDHHKTIIAFVKLGEFLREFFNSQQKTGPWNEKLVQAIELSKHKNGWFTPENVHFSLREWGKLLTQENLENWLSSYNLKENREKTVALVMAGNIPLVGFHDFICVLVSGNKVLAKLSSSDEVLISFIRDYIVSVEPLLKTNIQFTKEQLKNFDAVIATGSNNTSRYFEHYFSGVPNIIRKNRNSVALLKGTESPEQLNALGEDIFRYFGLGCRSVSKIFIPKGYDFDILFKALYDYRDIVSHNKYANNYDYNKAVYLMSDFKILDNGFIIIKEDESYASPIASLFYEHYDTIQDLKKRLNGEKDLLQCVVANNVFPDEIEFGQTQRPTLSDYADNVDTVDFLLKN